MKDLTLRRALQIATNTSEFLRKQLGARQGGPYTEFLRYNDQFIASLNEARGRESKELSGAKHLASIFSRDSKDSSQSEEAHAFFYFARAYAKRVNSVTKLSAHPKLSVNLDTATLFFDGESGMKDEYLSGLDEETFSPDGSLVGMPIPTMKVHVFDTGSGEQVFSAPGRSEFGRTTIAFAPDNHRLAVASSSFMGDMRRPRISLYGPGGRAIWRKKSLRTEVWGFPSLSFSQQGDRLAVGSSGGRVAVFEAASGKKIFSRSLIDKRESPEEVLVEHCLFSPCGRLLSCAVHDMKPDSHEVVNLESGSGALVDRKSFDKPIFSLTYSKEGDRLAVVHGFSWYDATVLDSTNGNEMARYKATYKKLKGVDRSCMVSSAFSPDGSSLVVGIGKNILTSDGSSGEMIPYLKASHTIRFLKFSPDGKTLRAGVLGGSIETFDTSKVQT